MNISSRFGRLGTASDRYNSGNSPPFCIPFLDYNQFRKCNHKDYSIWLANYLTVNPEKIKNVVKVGTSFKKSRWTRWYVPKNKDLKIVVEPGYGAKSGDFFIPYLNIEVDVPYGLGHNTLVTTNGIFNSTYEQRSQLIEYTDTPIDIADELRFMYL